jgi:hypothetical protein
MPNRRCTYRGSSLRSGRVTDNPHLTRRWPFGRVTEGLPTNDPVWPLKFTNYWNSCFPCTVSTYQSLVLGTLPSKTLKGLNACPVLRFLWFISVAECWGAFQVRPPWSFARGPQAHVWAGRTFVATMLIMASAGVYLAIAKSRPGDVLGGALTLYLVATSCAIARRRNGRPSVFDCVRYPDSNLDCSSCNKSYRYEERVHARAVRVSWLSRLDRHNRRYPNVMRGGFFGARRIARHLWRMCFALFIASASIFLARQRLFPHFMRASGTLYLLSFLPLVLMIFWLLCVRSNRTSSRQLVRDATLSEAASDRL